MVNVAAGTGILRGLKTMFELVDDPNDGKYPLWVCLIVWTVIAIVGLMVTGFTLKLIYNLFMIGWRLI